MKRLSLIFVIAPSIAFAQQPSQQAVLESLYARYQRADSEAINLQAQVTELKKQLEEAKKAVPSKEPEKK